MKLELYYLFNVCIKYVCSFNIDVENIISFKGDNGTMFGYTAVLLSNDDGNWVVVGAPKARFLDRPEIKTPGNIYKCKVNFTRFQQENCLPISIRTEEDTRWPDLPGYEEDNQLLGAAMAHLNNKIVICAPLWKNMIPLRDENITHPIGRCHNLDKTLITFSTDKFSKSRLPASSDMPSHQFAEAGFSISSKEMQTNDAHSVLLGAPGFFSGKGGFLTYTQERVNNFFKSYTHMNINSYLKNSILPSSLMGYSIATGYISFIYNCPNVVVLGAPHLYTNIGAVLVVCLASNNNVEVKKQVFGKKHGSGFGSAIVFDDINNDGLDDLMVGAPLHYDRVIDSGAVYVFFGSAEGDVLVESQLLKGSESESARFGTALECMGDVNKDGYKDLIVGAPYEDHLSGAIYIYHGGPEVLTLSQVIHASNIDNQIVSFGWFISSSLDIDQNNYPDFVVGSYLSDTVSLLRTRPIIKLSCTIKIHPPVIPLNSTGQECQDDNFRPCANVQICFNFSGIEIPEKILVSYNINADTLRTNAKKASRVSIYVNNTNYKSTYREENIEVRKGDHSCRSFVAIVPMITRQFLSALKDELRFKASFGLSNEAITGQVKPILDKQPEIENASAMFSSGCNGTCHPNVKLEVSVEPRQIIFGRTGELVLHIRVTNNGEPSHGTRITVLFTNSTSYLGYYQPQGQLTEPGDCSEEYDPILNCDLTRTLYQKHQGLFNVRFNVSQEMLTTQMSNRSGLIRFVGFNIRVTSTSSDTDILDNTVAINVSVKFISELQILGISQPEQHRLSKLQSVVFTHKYDLYNSGPSPLIKGVVRICQPVIGDNKLELFKVVSDSPKLNWRISQGYINWTLHNMTNLHTTLPTPTLAEFMSMNADTQVQEDTKSIPYIRKISCKNVQNGQYVIYYVTVNELDVGESISFDIPIVIHRTDINFEKAYAILYMTTGEIEYIDNDSFSVMSINTTSHVVTEIFPEVLTTKPAEINMWIIIGGCFGGVVLLMILGVVLGKCGFFQREKKAAVDRWKRQTCYAFRRSQMVNYTPRHSLL